MITYTVSYRKLGTEQWQCLPDVIVDGFIPNLPLRFFVKSTGERFELPSMECEFAFGKERAELLQAQHEAAEKAKAQAKGDPDAC